MTQAMKKTKGNTVNGVSVDALHETISAVRKDPRLAPSKFRLTNKWIGQALNESTVGDFYVAGEERKHKATFKFRNDEGEVLLGRDEDANPVEYVLHALAGCITTTTIYHAAANGINIHSLETTLEGDIDIRGLFAISDEVPCGYSNIRVTMDIKSDANSEELVKLKTFYKYSPVFDTITRPVKVDMSVQVN